MIRNKKQFITIIHIVDHSTTYFNRNKIAALFDPIRRNYNPFIGKESTQILPNEQEYRRVFAREDNFLIPYMKSNILQLQY